MPGIVEFPQLVEQARQYFADLFCCEPQRDHFAEYLTGLLLAERKTVLGIHQEFAETTDQSCLNKFLTRVDWDVDALNERRLQLLQEASSTRYDPNGVIALDNVLIDHDGKLIEDVGWFWDHAEQRYKIAHDYLFANYVCPNGKHFPLEFRRFKKREQCEADEVPFENHTHLFCELVDWVCERDIPGDFVFDSYFTNAAILNHIASKQDCQGRTRGYVGDLKFNRKVQHKGTILRADQLAASIPSDDRKEIRRGDKRQWYFTCTLTIPEVNHRIRIVILWDKRRDKEPCKILVSNRVYWEVNRIVKVYRKRWTGTETFHRDGKQQLGMGDCQLRNGQGQTRHMHMVMLAYSLLMIQLNQSSVTEWAVQRLTTIGQACRAMLRESMRKTLGWAIEKVTQQTWSPERVYTHLGLTGGNP